MTPERVNNAILNGASGFMPPRPGEGVFICNKCGKSFYSKSRGILSEIFGSLFVRCPECGSGNTKRDTRWVY